MIFDMEASFRHNRFLSREERRERARRVTEGILSLVESHEGRIEAATLGLGESADILPVLTQRLGTDHVEVLNILDRQLTEGVLGYGTFQDPDALAPRECLSSIFEQSEK